MAALGHGDDARDHESEVDEFADIELYAVDLLLTNDVDFDGAEFGVDAGDFGGDVDGIGDGGELEVDFGRENLAESAFEAGLDGGVKATVFGAEFAGGVGFDGNPGRCR